MKLSVDATYIIRRPLVTERTTSQMNESNTYTFAVDRRASKDQIKDAVESLFGVRVLKVRTSTRKNRERRLKYGYVRPAPQKRAFVRLHEDDRIELF